MYQTRQHNWLLCSLCLRVLHNLYHDGAQEFLERIMLPFDYGLRDTEGRADLRAHILFVPIANRLFIPSHQHHCLTTFCARVIMPWLKENLLRPNTLSRRTAEDGSLVVSSSTSRSQLRTPRPYPSCCMTCCLLFVLCAVHSIPVIASLDGRTKDGGERALLVAEGGK